MDDVVLQRAEYGGVPAGTRPDLSGDLSDRAAALKAEPIWARIERFTRYWWGERSFTWHVDGLGWFRPPVRPVDVQSVEVCIIEGMASSWIQSEIIETPAGFWIAGRTYKLEGMAGDTETPPDDVIEAFRRLAEYYAELESEGMTGAESYRLALPDFTESWRRPAHSVARALELSGAADLLKRWRYV